MLRDGEIAKNQRTGDIGDGSEGQSGCGCGPEGCGAPALPRRRFLQVAGLGMLATSVGRPRTAMAGPFENALAAHGQLIPPDKKLDAAWLRHLLERGAKEVFSGEALERIGMPCGGIGTGQLYLCGDGSLGSWQIFNNMTSYWVEGTSATYQQGPIPKPVEQEFAVAFMQGRSRTVKPLRKGGFAEISFQGEYPIATVRYSEPDCPIEAAMEVFSPFCPLEAEDSALPATIFNITVTNTSDAPVSAAVLGCLENAVCLHSGAQYKGVRTTAFRAQRGGMVMRHGVKAPAPPEGRQNATVFADFEAENYGDWKVQGDAFGVGPVPGTLVAQQEVTGFAGERLVNSFQGGDVTTGKLISPQFTIERPYINLRVGGGQWKEESCVNLVVDTEVIESITGDGSEALRWRSWYVGELAGRNARIEIVDASTAAWGHILVDQIEFDDAPRNGMPLAIEMAGDYGSLALGLLGPAQPRPVAGEREVTQDATYGLTEKRIGLVESAASELAAGESKTFSYVLSWHFPNDKAGKGWRYARRFADAAAVNAYALEHHGRLTADTRRWRDTYYDSTLPYWLLDRLQSTVSTLATGTCQWWADGRFYAFEGNTCCGGTCTHVWNYAHSHARLFPELARNIRENQDFMDRERGGGFHPDTGLVGFRSDGNYAADGQCGTVLKAYREHLMSPDASFLHRFWPRIRKALEYSMGQDGNADGLIESTQHNTYDINYEGPNTFVGALYLAALRAGEAMAHEVGDEAFANHARAVYEAGRQRTLERLWDGEYFTQDVDLEENPANQYGPGCLSDQLFGQGWAHQVGLGYLYPEAEVRSALGAVWKYNWAPDITPYNEAHKPFRWFISPGQAGLFTCTWPKTEYLPRGTAYKNEVWTGIEYQVAGHMIWEGMVEEGLAICRAVHDRYHPLLFNPYNEVECGDHYARGMASWGVYLALMGFRYHGPKGHIGFAPKIQADAFRAAFTAAEGWGTFEQTRTGKKQVDRITLHHGRLRLQSLEFERTASGEAARVRVQLDGERVGAEATSDGARVQITLVEPVVLGTGATFEVEIA